MRVLLTGCQGFIGKNKGDLVEVSTPAGVKNFEIIDVKYN